ncbi:MULTISPECIES: hypothetical protein [unclassified Nostoc]|uniref:hypothetical protein n=1 Tax=unclassified Nostoc TaxID=2593658 RepID=UPI0015E47678|nr:hypothetical protein [Nostoc sp. 'Peltigera membranacea cyanobiont' N6]
MNETLPATLGELQAQIYWLHDAEEFAELASAAATIYETWLYSTAGRNGGELN